eukprot:gene3692-4601_t
MALESFINAENVDTEKVVSDDNSSMKETVENLQERINSYFIAIKFSSFLINYSEMEYLLTHLLSNPINLILLSQELTCLLDSTEQTSSEDSMLSNIYQKMVKIFQDTEDGYLAYILLDLISIFQKPLKQPRFTISELYYQHICTIYPSNNTNLINTIFLPIKNSLFPTVSLSAYSTNHFELTKNLYFGLLSIIYDGKPHELLPLIQTFQSSLSTLISEYINSPKKSYSEDSKFKFINSDDIINNNNDTTTTQQPQDETGKVKIKTCKIIEELNEKVLDHKVIYEREGEEYGYSMTNEDDDVQDQKIHDTVKQDFEQILKLKEQQQKIFLDPFIDTITTTTTTTNNNSNNNNTAIIVEDDDIPPIYNVDEEDDDDDNNNNEDNNKNTSNANSSMLSLRYSSDDDEDV